MAAQVEAREGEKLITVERYADVRGGMRDADVLMFRGESLCSKICAIGGGGAYSHAGLVFWEKDRVRLVQATGKNGVWLCNLSEELHDYRGAIELWRVEPRFERPPFDPRGAIDEANRCVGAKYAYSLLWKFFWDWLFHPVFRKSFRSRAQSRRAFFCSQLVAHAYRVGGKLDLDMRHGDAATGPGDLPHGGRIGKLCAFAHDDVVDRLPVECRRIASCGGDSR